MKLMPHHFPLVVESSGLGGQLSQEGFEIVNDVVLEIVPDGGVVENSQESQRRSFVIEEGEEYGQVGGGKRRIGLAQLLPSLLEEGERFLDLVATRLVGLF